jgi:hypothetical protein
MANAVYLRLQHGSIDAPFLEVAEAIHQLLAPGIDVVQNVLLPEDLQVPRGSILARGG